MHLIAREDIRFVPVIACAFADEELSGMFKQFPASPQLACRARARPRRSKLIAHVRVRRASAITSTIKTAAPIAQTPSALMLAPQRLTRSLSDMTQLSLKGSELFSRGVKDQLGCFLGNATAPTI
jgi:hypothetical protein